MLTLAKTAVLYARPERETVARYAVPVSSPDSETMPDGFQAAYENKNAEPETIAFVFDYGNGKRSVEHIPANRQAREAIAARQLASAEPETLSQQLHRETMERKSAQRAALDSEFAEHDWSTKPTSWTREAVLYYLEFVCGECVSHDMRTATDFVTSENLAMAMDQFRKRNTTTARATVPRAALLNAVKNAKKLNPRSPAKTVSLRINGSLDVITSDNEARFSQAVEYDSKSGDLRLTLPEQRLTQICSKLKSKTVELVLTSCEPLAEHVLTIKTDSASFTIPVELPNDADKFASDFPATFAHNLTAGELLRAFRMTEFATDTESTRYALAGCFIQPAENSLDIAATDSRRLSVETIPAEVLGAMPELKRGETRHPLGVVVPPGIVALLMDELKRQPESAVVSFATADIVTRRKELEPPAELSAKAKANWKPSTIGFVCLSDGVTTRNMFDGEKYWQEDTRREFVFELSGAFSVRGIPQEGRFPRYMDVIPNGFESRYEIQRAAMLEQCETILLSTDEESRGVDFVFPASESDCNVRLKAKSETLGTANAIFHCETVDSTERHTITLDANFLAEYLKCSQAKFVTVNIQDCQTAILITADDGNGRYVQMPLTPDR